MSNLKQKVDNAYETRQDILNLIIELRNEKRRVADEYINSITGISAMIGANTLDVLLDTLNGLPDGRR